MLSMPLPPTIGRAAWPTGSPGPRTPARQGSRPRDGRNLSPSAPRPPDSAASKARPDAELRIVPDFSASPAASSPDTAPRARAVDDDIQLGETEISAHRQASSKFARGAVMSLFAVVSAIGAA